MGYFIIDSRFDDISQRWKKRKCDITICRKGGKIPSRICILFINARIRNHGVGTKIMNEVCERADELKIPLTLMPQPLDKYKISYDGLVRFYRRFGFRKCHSDNSKRWVDTHDMYRGVKRK
jgi:GNAT superfamily N-acetyltransferase